MISSRTTIATLRFSTGFRPGETPPDGPEALMAALRATAAEKPLIGAKRKAKLWQAAFAMRRAREMAKGGDDEDAQMQRKARRGELVKMLHAARFGRLRHAVLSPNGFGERMARFWADHFTVARRNVFHGVALATYQDEAIRPNLTARFSDMLTAVARHPAMLIYLDQSLSVGPNSSFGRRKGKGLNENLAREIMELHTLGVDGEYGQEDVVGLAKLLTGMGVRKGDYVYRRKWAEPGPVRFLGKRWQGASERDALDALEMLAARPETARHIARKLAIHFVADAPPEALVGDLEAVFRDSGGDLEAVCAALVGHDAAWGPLGAKARQPEELIVAGLRAAGAGPEDMKAEGPFGARATLTALRAMGQRQWRAPGPNGWPEEKEAWITPGGLAARLEWATRVSREMVARADPRDLAKAALADALSADTAFAVAAASERWEGATLLLASPDFNLR